eukprot:TRINITY_DN17067_c0_g1_i1.p1 TRINITY_DN17067_c0_g1~~TRINITY_DN17067_c0_g1_i1.p1  ORF type:complete len:1759 (-),score=465.14 TRINITY_DN17067_c0_g1_i1:110-4714(-)
MCAYLGWGKEEWCLMDRNQDEKISRQEFEYFVGKMGGVRQLFERRRLRISTSRKDVCDYIGIAEGARVRAHYYVQGQKSRTWREAQVLKVSVHMHFGKADLGPGTFGVLLQFGFGTESTKQWTARQVVPPSWILSGVEDANVASALRESGILDEQQAFWSLLLPESEMQAIARLESCQRNALSTVRAQASKLHDEALPKLKEKFKKLGYGPDTMGNVLDWIQDLAPVLVHLHLDRVGAFMEIDEFYRNQFETKTSCGALDPENNTRKGWEHELFGGAYDEAKPFDRCKYGALSVMNDYRGVVSARQYGDSYLVLKDVRLRCTFASTDSGGISGSRLAVLDKYAHVLNEYNDNELQGVILVAEAAKAGTSAGTVRPELLRGSSEDPTMDWITMGYPNLAKDSGKYYFEVHLIKGAYAPQVGLLSKDFKKVPGVSSTKGVGDDEHGWAVDGQSAIRWHNGSALCWTQTWPSSEAGRQLQADVIVGVAVDLDERKLRFSTDGKWDDDWEVSPTFGKDEIPAGVSLYPAISLKGRAAFVFSSFKYPPPAKEGDVSVFKVWPNGPQGAHRLDVSHIGNSELLGIYKEVQIHGELSLKRNVQRLVAARKYRERTKMERNWGLQVKNAGALSGSYKRVGAHDGMPLYKSTSGCLVYFDAATAHWRLALQQPPEVQFSKWYCSAPCNDAKEPPRRGWDLPDEERGILSVDCWRKGMVSKGLSYEVIDGLASKLSHKDPDGKDSVYRAKAGVIFEEVWTEMVKEPPCDAKEAWNAGVRQAQDEMMALYGVPAGSQVVETAHPYEAKGAQWTKEVTIPGAARMVVHFCQKSCTYDSCASVTVSSGGMRRDAAGPGARLEVAGCNGQKVWGTAVERSKEGWKVLLDRTKPPKEKDTTTEWPKVGDEVKALYRSGNWYSATVESIKEEGGEKIYIMRWHDGDTKDKEKKRADLKPPDGDDKLAQRNLELVAIYKDTAPQDLGTQCFAYCKEEPKNITVKYAKKEGPAFDEQGFGATVGDELLQFKLDRTCPMMPIVVEKLSSVAGPAQDAGVREGWYLDLLRTFGGPSRDQLREIVDRIGGKKLESADASEVLAAVMANLDDFMQLLHQKVRALDVATLFFTDSSSASQPVLLPEVRVCYAEKANSEIKDLIAKNDEVILNAWEGQGPAQAGGVRLGWALDWERTVSLNEEDEKFSADDEIKSWSQQDLLKDPNAILTRSGLWLAFKNLQPVKTRLVQACGGAGQACWKSLEVLGDYACFDWVTDGDGASVPEARWGFWALISVPPPEDLEKKKKEEEELLVTVEIEKKEGSMLGISVQGVDNQLVITEVEAEGLMADWNKANPEKQVKAHDRIVEVNGVKEDSDALTKELEQFKLHKLLVKRVKKGPECKAGHELVKDPRTHHRCDVCGSSGTEFRCPSGCDYDLCLSCHRSATSGTSEIHCPVKDIDEFAKERLQVVARGEGNSAEPEVEREDWDEERLKALCARHGWDFEWMTEDGERRRRANERLTEWRLEESMTGLLHADEVPEMPDEKEPTAWKLAPVER